MGRVNRSRGGRVRFAQKVLVTFPATGYGLRNHACHWATAGRRARRSRRGGSEKNSTSDISHAAAMRTMSECSRGSLIPFHHLLTRAREKFPRLARSDCRRPAARAAS